MTTDIYRSMDDTFAEALKLARLAAGLSQADVAAEMAQHGYDVGQPTIGKIERGERRVSIGEGVALSAIVGQPTRMLLNGGPELRLALASANLERRRDELERAERLFEEADLEMQLAEVEVRGAE